MKNIKKSYKNYKFKIVAPKCNEKFQLPGGSYSLSRLLWIYLKKHGEKTDNSCIIIYVNKTENRIIFKIKTGYIFNF